MKYCEAALDFGNHTVFAVVSEIESRLLRGRFHSDSGRLSKN